jgi:hypothetical protein
MSDAITVIQTSMAQALEDLHTRIAAVVLGLDEAALNWQPTPAMSSLHGMIAHAAAQERRWIGEGVANIPAADEGRLAVLALSAGQPADRALFELGSIGQVSQMILANLATHEWDALRQVDGRVTTVAGCVLQTLVELGRVLGHMENTAQLWETRAPQANSGSHTGA